MTGDQIGPRIMRKGGGGTSTTSSGIDPEFKPYLTAALAGATKQLDKDLRSPGANVAGFSPEQQMAQSATAGLAQQRLNEDRTGMIQDDLARLQGRQIGGMANKGVLGSARAQAARQGALADRAMQLRDADYAAKSVAAQQLGAVGAEKQALGQKMKDAPHDAYSKYFGYLTGAAPKQQTTTQSGGGK